MSEWKEVCLGEVCDKIGSGATPTGGKSAYCDTGISLIRSQNVLDFTFLKDGLAHINELQARKLNNVNVEENDVLLNITGDSVARACIVPIEYLPARVNQHVAIIRPNKNRLDNNFCLYFLQKEKNKLLSLASSGATRNALTKNMIEEFPIALPDLPTQRRIASILSSLDAKIENNNKINAKLEEIAQNLFKEWFVDFGPFKNGKFVESELGLIPEGWRVVSLGDIIDTTSGGTPSRKNEDFYTEGTINWVKSKELKGSYILSTEEQITDDAVKKSSAKLLPNNAVLIAMYGATVGEYGIISKEMACNQAICALLSNEHVPYTFLFMLAKNKKEDIINMAVGSAQQNISQVLIKGLKIVYNEGICLKYHTIVEPIFERKKLIEEENQRLATLRDTLLPKLMSGEIEV